MSDAGLDELLMRLWQDYTALNPQARAVHELLLARGEHVVNDHVALRTFDDERVDIDVLARAFVEHGYAGRGRYEFPDKKLDARHFEHAEEQRPKIFISQLRLGELSASARGVVGRLLDELPPDVTRRSDFVVCGRPWQVSWSEYETLRSESEYAAWLAAFGFRANHFTVSVHHLRTFTELAELNAYLTACGFALNDSGGLIKGSPDELLEQSATLAAPIAVDFNGERREIPGCYYEFARRYPAADGRLFQGFIARSADRIFESTDRRD